MKHFISEDKTKLIQFNPETGVYKQRNHDAKETNIFTEEEFIKLNPKKIKRQEFSRLMNIHYKNVKHEWKFNHTYYRKLPNFESDGYSLITNYENLPTHIIEGMEWLGKVYLVLIYS